MAFDKYLGYRSQGVNPSMYSDNRDEAMRMMDEDMAARWNQDRAGFQKAMLDQRMMERQGRQGNAAPEDKPQEAAPAHQAARPAHAQVAVGGDPWQHPLAAAHFDAQQDMIASTNRAVANEMDSRREQAEAERDRQHEYEMESLKQQRNLGQEQDATQYRAQADAAKQARNRSLLGAAGLGGHTIRSGPGGVTRTPHAFGNSPFASALLGD